MITDLNEYKIKKGLNELQDKNLIEYHEDGDKIKMRLNTAFLCTELNRIMDMEFSKSQYDKIIKMCEGDEIPLTLYLSLMVKVTEDINKKMLGEGKVTGQLKMLFDSEEYNPEDRVECTYYFKSKKTKKTQAHTVKMHMVDITMTQQIFDHIDIMNPIVEGDKIRFKVLAEDVDYLIDGAKPFGYDMILGEDGFFYAREEF